MEPFTRELDALEQQIERLKREYDLFLAGKRRGEPLALREEIEQDILRLTRSPSNTTATRFRVRSLAHRFRAVVTQVRNIVELRVSRARGKSGETGENAFVLLDRAAVADPTTVEPELGRMQRALSEAISGPMSPSFDVIRQRLFAEARRQMGAPEVVAVRFTVVRKEGRPKIKGEVVRVPSSGRGETGPAPPQR